MENAYRMKKSVEFKREGTHVLTACEGMYGREDIDDNTEDGADGSDNTEASTDDKERISPIIQVLSRKLRRCVFLFW